MRKLWAWPALVLLLAPAGLSASTIYATFTGTVTSVTECPEENCQDPFGGFFAIGDAVSGSFRVAVGQADTQPNDRYGYYPASNAVIQVGGHSPYIGGSAVVKILDGYYGSSPLDQFRMEVSCCPSGPIPAEGWSPVFWVIHGSEDMGLVFSDDSLPTDLSFDDLDRLGFALRFWNGFTDAAISGTVTAFAYAVPEPAIGMLLLAAVLGPGFWHGARRKR